MPVRTLDDYLLNNFPVLKFLVCLQFLQTISLVVTLGILYALYLANKKI